MPGPLPNPQRRRRNAPTIPTTNLPASGRKDRAPTPPTGYEFGKAAKRWWTWAWHTPQSAAWDDGALYFIARRAQIEDDLAALSGSVAADAVALSDLLGIPNDERVREVANMFSLVKRAASGEVALMKEARELDNRLGLNPEAMAKLRWQIADEDSPAIEKTPAAPSARRLRAVDPTAA